MDDFEQPSTTNEQKSHLLLLLYQGQKGDFVLKSMRKRLKTSLPSNFNMQIAFKGKKLHAYFRIKGTVSFEHKLDHFYPGKHPASNCNNDYIGETGQYLLERIRDHDGRDINSHLLKHHVEKASMSSK